MPVPAGLQLAELKQLVDVQLSTHDPVLELHLEAAYLQAQAPPPYGCGRLLTPDPEVIAPTEEDPDPDQPEPVTRRVRLHGSRFVRVPDARELTTVEADGVELVAETDYEILERNDHIVRLELFRRPRVIILTGRFGFAEIPANLREAIYILAARSFYERGAQFADQVALAEGLGVQQYFRQLPPRVRLVFAAYAFHEVGLA